MIFISVNALELLLQQMIDIRASDLHLIHNEFITFRVDREIKKENKRVRSSDIYKMLTQSKVLTDNQLNTFHEKQAADFAYTYNNVRFRGNLTKEKNHYTCVMRRLSDKVIPIDQMSLPSIITREIQKEDGLILVTGPTGSGKTTTLTSLIDYVNQHKPIHIATIEEPIEYVHSQKEAIVTQQEVGKDTPSFAIAMRSMLRRDPDVILVGEMRDPETIEIACTAAETGHLVFGTLHTNTAVSSVDRIVTSFPGIQQENIQSQLATNLRLVINQRLFPKIGGGVIPGYEVMVLNDEIRKAIRARKLEDVYPLMREARNIGNVLMEDSIKKLIDSGLIDPNKVY